MGLKRERSLTWQLIRLNLGLIVPSIAFVGVLIWQLASSERARFEEEARGLARGFAVALDREIYGVLTTLQALATSPSLQAQNFAAFYEQAKSVSELQKINISLRDPAGFAYLTTRAPFGEKVPVPTVLVQEDQNVLRNGRANVSNIFKSTVSGRPVFQIIDAPVYVDGRPSFLLGASIEVEQLADAVRREHLP